MLRLCLKNATFFSTDNDRRNDTRLEMSEAFTQDSEQLDLSMLI